MNTAVSRERVQSWSFDAFVVGIVLAGNGRTFGVGLGDGTIRIVQPEGAEPVSVAAHDGACLSLCADIDDDAFLSGGDDGKLIRIAGNGEVATVAELKGKWIDHVTAHAGAGTRVYAAGKDVYVIDRKNRQARKMSHATTVGGLAINPKGRRLAVSHYNGVTLWWLAAQESKPQSLEWKGSHLQAAWSPDGEYVMTIMQENALHGWRLTDAQHMRMSGYEAKVRSMAFTRRGQLLATGGSQGVICWPFSSGGPMGKAPLEFGGGLASAGLGMPVTAVACSPKNDAIAAGFENGAVIIGFPGTRVLALSGPRKAPVTAVAWDAAGERLIVGDEIGDVLLFDLRV